MSFHIESLQWKLSDAFALEIPTLHIPPGVTTLLLGPSGCGKSSVLKLLARLEDAYFPDPKRPLPTGKIWYEPRESAMKVDLLALSEQQLLNDKLRGHQIGFVFQREAIFSDLSVLDNVRWPLITGGQELPQATERAHAILSRVGLQVDRAVSTLSGGERKRLALARTLAPDPDVILMDEPFTGLDPTALDALVALTASIAHEAGKTIVLVTHQRSNIETLGDHVVLLNQGKVVVSGTRNETASELEQFLNGNESN